MIGELNHPVENELYKQFEIHYIDEALNFAPKISINKKGKINIESIDIVQINKFI